MADKSVRLLTPESLGDRVVEVQLESVPVWVSQGYRLIQEEDYSPDTSVSEAAKEFAEEVQAWHDSHDYSGNEVENPPERPATPLKLAEDLVAKVAARGKKAEPVPAPESVDEPPVVSE